MKIQKLAKIFTKSRALTVSGLAICFLSGACEELGRVIIDEWHRKKLMAETKTEEEIRQEQFDKIVSQTTLTE